MNRAGQVMARFAPPQYAWHGVGETCSADYQVAPNGIQRATVSPDGQHVAYTATALFQDVGCSTVVNVYTSYVVGRTGGGAVHLADIQAIDASEVGGWSGNATILLSNSAFDDTKLYTVSIPANHATAWKSNTDEWDQAWEGPSRGGTLLATSGYSDAAAVQVVRLWNAPSLTSGPTVRCEIAATAGTSDPNVSGFPLAWPVSVAPSGTAVTWQEVNGDSQPEHPRRGHLRHHRAVHRLPDDQVTHCRRGRLAVLGQRGGDRDRAGQHAAGGHGDREAGGLLCCHVDVDLLHGP